MVYFDNAATTFPKPACVLEEVNRCIKKYCGNPGRSSHVLSIKASEEIYSARENVANLFNAELPEGVVFTYNATYSLNLALKVYAKENCHILTTDIEHNATIRPLESLKSKKQITYTCVPIESFNTTKIAPFLTENTLGIVANISSNVCGYKISLKDLSDVASKYNLFLIVDASQAAGHIEINLKDTPCDVICAPGHKSLFGIQGCGFAIFSENSRKDSFIEGGSGSDSENSVMPLLLPEGYEAGTLGTPSIVSLGKGINYINSIGIDNIQKKLSTLVDSAYDVLSSFSKIEIYPKSSSLLSFNYGNIPSGVISSELDKLGICTRAGLHCAPLAHRKLGTIENGCIRISFSYLNQPNEIDKLFTALKTINNKY